MNEKQKELIKKIKQLKKQRNAIILVHNYQKPEIYEVADFIGDSFGLAKKAMQTKADVIVFCGVDFMAESAKILNPDKTVLIPDPTANCPMAAMVTAEKLREAKKKYPEAGVVCYVNTTAEVKAECDMCVTSSNAVRIVQNMPQKQILFVPDKNLAEFVAKNVKGKKIIPWNGFCYVHHKINESAVREARVNMPNAKIVAHPECQSSIVKWADYTCSTTGMIDFAKNTNANKIVVATEQGMIERLKKEVPNKEFYSIGGVCVNMKKNNLEKVYKSLQTLEPKVELDEEIRLKARNALQNMMDA
ncbi:quinolinate synthase NadA [Nanoarchaeota archaeon]